MNYHVLAKEAASAVEMSQASYGFAAPYLFLSMFLIAVLFRK